MNGVWVENDRLFVKEACFGYSDEKPKVKLSKYQDGKQLMSKERENSYSFLRTGEVAEKGGGVKFGSSVSSGEVIVNGRGVELGPTSGFDRSFIQALKGESSKPGPEQSIKMLVKPVGNG
ncbi:hypothetical protein RHMOL_Rhmol11G0170500 [Rhododendron molle]|uniref:Uncharacterized protein n=1 Tax=Rhododendron molle TaxID=49168 RepID=A0ACC0LU90_RHOML|nr:hypothetical protein RHMOL_Rhmol11G0170500 [Rhododendron molle]